jgi:hypothetical protein
MEVKSHGRLRLRYELPVDVYQQLLRTCLLNKSTGMLRLSTLKRLKAYIS